MAEATDDEIRSIVAAWTKAVREDRPPLILGNPELVEAMTPLLNEAGNFRDALILAACTTEPVSRIQDYALGVPGSKDLAKKLFDPQVATDQYIDTADMVCSGLANRLRNPIDKATPTAMRSAFSWYAGRDVRALDFASKAMQLNSRNALATLMLKAVFHCVPSPLRQNQTNQIKKQSLKHEHSHHQTR